MECLAKQIGQDVDKRRVLDALYFDHSDGGPEKDDITLRVLSYKARRMLQPFGLTITAHGGGRGGGGTLRLEALT